MTIMRVKANAGFSLVEVSLALLVAALGLLSIMSLFPVGMDASRKAIDEAQCALFADEIFSGIRARMSLPGVRWDDLNNVQVGAPAPDMWQGGESIRFRVNSSGTNIYTYRYEPSMQDYAVRYAMTVGENASVPGVRYLRLTLWNGEYGGTTNPMVFYTELYDTGQ